MKLGAPQNNPQCLANFSLENRSIKISQLDALLCQCQRLMWPVIQGPELSPYSQSTLCSQHLIQSRGLTKSALQRTSKSTSPFGLQEFPVSHCSHLLSVSVGLKHLMPQIEFLIFLQTLCRSCHQRDDAPFRDFS